MSRELSADEQVLKALNHPVRRKVIGMLDAGVASPKEIAQQLGITVPAVSYHFGVLRKLGLIKVVRETPRRGAVERHYQVVKRAISARQVVDYVLESDQIKPRGWAAKVIELDSAGKDAIEVAMQRLWKDIDKVESQVKKRAGRGAPTSRLAVGTFRAPQSDRP